MSGTTVRDRAEIPTLRGVELMEVVYDFLKKNPWAHDQGIWIRRPGGMSLFPYMTKTHPDENLVTIPGTLDPVRGHRACVGGWAVLITERDEPRPLHEDLHHSARRRLGITRDEAQWLFAAGGPWLAEPVARRRLKKLIRKYK